MINWPPPQCFCIKYFSAFQNCCRALKKHSNLHGMTVKAVRAFVEQQCSFQWSVRVLSFGMFSFDTLMNSLYSRWCSNTISECIVYGSRWRCGHRSAHRHSMKMKWAAHRARCVRVACFGFIIGNCHITLTNTISTVWWAFLTPRTA